MLVIMLVLLSVGCYGVLKKAGDEKYILGLVPVINLYRLFCVFWDRSIFAIMALLCLIGVLAGIPDGMLCRVLRVMAIICAVGLWFLLAYMITSYLKRSWLMLLVLFLMPSVALIYLGYFSPGSFYRWIGHFSEYVSGFRKEK